jgi:hypothetical protein
VAKIRGVKPDYWTDEDIVDLSIPARLLFIGLWSYACDNGHLQDKSKQIKMRVMPGDDVNVAELLRELESADRIERAAGWITVPNFTKHQKPDKRFFQTCEAPGCSKPGGSQPETRSAHHEPTSSTRGGLAVGSMGTHGDGDGEVMVSGGDGDTPRELALPETPRPDIEGICQHLADSIAANGSKRPEITKRWRDAARLMLDRDGRTEQEIHGAIDWCQADEFWRANVLSLPTLRDKYDQLRLQAQRRSGSTSRNEEWRAMQDRQMARAEAREREMGLR